MATITVYLRSGDVESATRAFQMTKVAHSQGHQASLFMSDDGVYWADKNRSLDEKTGTKDTAAEFLPYLVENEVPVNVCPPLRRSSPGGRGKVLFQHDPGLGPETDRTGRPWKCDNLLERKQRQTGVGPPQPLRTCGTSPGFNDFLNYHLATADPG